MPGRRLDLDTTMLRSFARAAALVGRTQPAVTLQIARLESLLGTKLLTRTSASGRGAAAGGARGARAARFGAGGARRGG